MLGTFFINQIIFLELLPGKDITYFLHESLNKSKSR